MINVAAGNWLIFIYLYVVYNFKHCWVAYEFGPIQPYWYNYIIIWLYLVLLILISIMKYYVAENVNA